MANVTLVDTTTINTDQRGTNGANTLAPDNAGITANGAAIGGLNDITAAEVDAEITSTHGAGSYLTGTAVDISTLATRANQQVLLDGIEDASLIIPFEGTLPDA